MFCLCVQTVWCIYCACCFWWQLHLFYSLRLASLAYFKSLLVRGHQCAYQVNFTPLFTPSYVHEWCIGGAVCCACLCVWCCLCCLVWCLVCGGWWFVFVCVVVCVSVCVFVSECVCLCLYV